VTSLASWIAVDSRGPSSMYVASDSRVTWPSGHTWDHSRKVFVCRRFPDLLGYCGDVLFASQILSQVVSTADSGCLFRENLTSEERSDAYFDAIENAWKTYPRNLVNKFTVLHCSRENSGMASVFKARLLSYNGGSDWKTEILTIPTASGLIGSWGSGNPVVKETNELWKKSDVGGTSRSVFSSFCDAVSSTRDPKTGGPPQLAGIYREKLPEAIGVVCKDRKYLYGADLSNSSCLDAVEWRNELFERCDWKTGQRLAGAQAHNRPKMK
jgi:hypothetical protein